ncbi:hypothetical protein DRJ25_03495 [Candidatus Woesearchaeota archaeon]|nr:MAG: hypothetical protein DRJ25_03495 [Candidatus Woesearchaeota archaeon]
MASFADKLNKATTDFSTHCPVCGEAISYVKLVYSEKSEKTGAIRFNQKMVGICKCNEKEITG